MASAVAPFGAALFGAALVIAVFGPKGSPPGAPKAQPFVTPDQGPTESPQPSGETVAARGDVDAARLSDVGPVKIASTEERPTGLAANASSAAAPLAPPAAGVAQPTAGTSAEPPAAQLAVAETAAPPPTASQSPDSNLQRSPSAPKDATPAPSTEDAAPRDAPQRPAEPALTTEKKVAAVAQPTASKPDLPAKPPRRTSVRGMAAKADASAPGAAAETRTGPQRPEASMTPPAPAEPQATTPSADPKEPVNLVAHAFGSLTGALGASSADQTKSGGWAIQFAAPKSEAEADAAAARLNAKYAPALNGATIAVHKTEVNGETIYALRVAGLSKADAAALCERVKGRYCSVVK